MSNDAAQLEAAASRLRESAGGPLEVAVVLGSGLADAVVERIENDMRIPYARLPGAPQPKTRIAGHRGEAIVGTWAGRKVVAFSGRVHLYQGCSGYEIAYFVRLAAATGVKTLILTNAAGGLNPTYRAGDIMIIKDQINLTGVSPIDASMCANPFVSMIDAYTPRLRDVALHGQTDTSIRCGIYAGVRGPAYETPAEIHWLQTIGADAVAMSTVLETIAARSLGLDVFGVSLITNTPASSTSIAHADVLTTAKAGSRRVATLLDRLLHKERFSTGISSD
jgi:purine-nucleoside phosphorylase